MARRAISISIGTALFLLSAAPVLAQFGIPGLEESVRIEASPSNPKPGEHVHLIAQSVLLDLRQMNVTWRVNNTIIAQGIGATEADFTVGGIGQVADVTLNAISDTNTAFARLTLVPSEVDLLWESDSYIPPFYRGRALPTEGTHVRLQAVPRLRAADGSLIPNGSLRFSWKQGGTIISSASGIGKSSAILPGPVLFGSDTYGVDVSSLDGTVSGSGSVSISSVQSFVGLYENHPLFGVLYQKPFGLQAYVPETEVTFQATPYYAPIKGPDDRTLVYNWRVNNTPIKSDELHRSAITINAGDSGGSAILNLDLSQNANFYLNISKQWQLIFSQAPESQNGFGGNAPDPFSGQ